MSQENVETVRRAFQAFNDRDVDAMLANWSDDVEMRLIGGFADLMGSEFRGHEGIRLWMDEWVGNLDVRAEIEYVIADGPAPGCWKGLAGMAEGFRGIVGAWEDYRTEVDAYRELDGERVLVLLRLSGRGKASGAELRELWARSANLFHVRDRKVTRLVLYWDCRSAGLPE